MQHARWRQHVMRLLSLGSAAFMQAGLREAYTAWTAQLQIDEQTYNLLIRGVCALVKRATYRALLTLTPTSNTARILPPHGYHRALAPGASHPSLSSTALIHCSHPLLSSILLVHPACQLYYSYRGPSHADPVRVHCRWLCVLAQRCSRGQTRDEAAAARWRSAHVSQLCPCASSVARLRGAACMVPQLAATRCRGALSWWDASRVPGLAERCGTRRRSPRAPRTMLQRRATHEAPRLSLDTRELSARAAAS